MMTRKSLLVLSLAGVLMLAACSNEGGASVAEAEAAFAAQNYIATRDAALSVLRDDNDNVEALTLLARAQIAMGLGADVPGTLARLERANALPEDAPLLAAEGLLQMGDADAAREHLVGQNSAEAWRLRALAAGLDQNDEAARDAFARGRDAPGPKYRLYAAEANFHLIQGEIDAAREAVARAQEAAPDRIETLFATAQLAQVDGDSDLAARAYHAILEIAPLDRPALLGAIAQMGELGRVDLLSPLVARGREAYPNDPEFRYLAARLLAENDDWNGVRNLLQPFENVLSEHPDSRGLYGQALLELGQVEQARAHLAPLYRAHPENPSFARVYARILMETGDAPEAREVIAPLVARPDALPEDRELAARAAQG